MSNNLKHILVIRLSAMGDVGMTVPVLRALTAQHPHIKITVLTRAFFAPFFRDLPNVNVFEADVKGEHKGVLGLYKLSKTLRNLNIDAVADLHNVLRSKILKFFLSGMPFQQIDKGRSEKKALISGKQFQQLKTTHERYADVFRKLGFSVDLSQPAFPKPTALNSKISKLVSLDTKPSIGIAPFAAFESKMYPLELMEQVIAEVSKTCSVILFGGGKHEEDLLSGLAEKYSNTVSVAGQLSLDEELDVISNLNMMLAMDSGNAHIAAMQGIPVITLWGVTHPFAGFTPFNQPQDNTLLADRHQFPKVPTSVYGKDYPEGYDKAIASITPEAIISKIKSLLK